MDINAISAYITNAWYGNDTTTDSSDPLLEADSSSTQTSSLLTSDTSDSSSYFDTVDISVTTGFFTKLKELEQSDPETFQQLFQKLGDTLKNAKGYAGQVLANMSQSVADGADITDVIV